MSQQSRSLWSNVDRMADPDWYVHYLDAISAMETMQAYKRGAFTLLAPQLGDTLLDVGCGLGGDAIALAERVGPGGKVVGVDNSERLIAEAARRGAASGLPVEFHVGDIYALDFPDGAFDGCRTDRVFQHLERPDAALAELLRVTRPGGRVVVGDTDWETVLIDAPDPPLTRTILNFVCDSHRNAWMGRQLYARFVAAGLADVRVRADTLLFTEYAAADLTVALETRVKQAQEADVITAAQAESWLAAVRAKADAGQFFGSLTLFTVAGIKP
jgi:ubiquinone/menaquinone biosynthesis C-methylase UbiE